MAHADYHCCAVCDRKMDYGGMVSRTKEDICTGCLRQLHALGASEVYDGQDLVEWTEGEPEVALFILDALKVRECYYDNPVDEAIEEARESRRATPTSEGEDG